MKSALLAMLSALVIAAVSAGEAAEPVDIPGTSWRIGGLSRLKVKRIGPFQQITIGRIDFRRDGRFLLVMENLFTLAGVYDCKRGRRCKLTPDPDGLEEALLSMIEGSLLGPALRGIEPAKTKFKVKFKTKRDATSIRTRFKIRFETLLALNVDNPDEPDAEVIEAFRTKYLFKGQGLVE